MSTPNKRRVEGLTFAENDTREVRIPKGFLEEGVVLSQAFTDTISGAATSARARGTPIRSLSVLTDGGKLLHNVRPQDAIREIETFEGASLGTIASPPTGLGVGAQVGTYDIPLLFRSSWAEDGIQTALPSWIYDEVIFRVEWGGHAQLYVGGAGAVTSQSLSLTALGVQEDFSSLGDPFVWGRELRRLIRQFREVAAPGAANAEFPIEVARTSDIRALVIVTEDANGEPVNTMLNAVTLEVNGTLRQFSRVPGRMIRADNAKTYGLTTMPPGMYVLDFAEDQDIGAQDILLATRMTTLNLILDVAAVAGTIRVAQIRIEPGPARAGALVAA